MMRQDFIIFLTLFCSTLGAKLDNFEREFQGREIDSDRQTVVGIVRYDNEPPLGPIYQFTYETEDGIKADEEGLEGSKGQANMIGGFSYTSPEGELIEIRYEADENGFVATGPYVPKWPAHALRQVEEARRRREEEGRQEQFE